MKYLLNERELTEALKPYWRESKQCPECGNITGGLYLLSGCERDKVIAQAQLSHALPLIRQDEALYLWDRVVCPLCYRLNPHHAYENKGKGCNWCQEKEDYTGQTLEQALKTKYGVEE